MNMPEIKCADCGKQIKTIHKNWLTNGHVFRCHPCAVRIVVKNRVTKQLANKVPLEFPKCTDCDRQLKIPTIIWITKNRTPRCVSCARKAYAALHKPITTLAYCSCGKQLKTPLEYWKTANKTPICRSCSAKNRPKLLGPLNGMFGKKHSAETKEKLHLAGKAWANEHANTTEFKQRCVAGMRSGFCVEPLFDGWVAKYGLDEAKNKERSRAAKIGTKMSGEGNHRFGKPPSRKSGRGWRGYYKGLFFRSLLELRFIITKGVSNIKSAETHEFNTPYTFNGITRSYSPDFVATDGTVYEIKPSTMVSLPINVAKFNAARLKFQKFEIVTEASLLDIDWQLFSSLVASKDIVIEPNSLAAIRNRCPKLPQRVRKCFENIT